MSCTSLATSTVSGAKSTLPVPSGKSPVLSHRIMPETAMKTPKITSAPSARRCADFTWCCGGICTLEGAKRYSGNFRAQATSSLSHFPKMSSLKNWSHYSIPIEYTNEDLLPTHVAIVFSSSKNGDQYLGAPGSVMEVDNVELIY